MFPSEETQKKLSKEKNIWFASVRADGRPHLVPIWFAWYEGKIFISIDSQSVKARNIRNNPNVVLSLEDGIHPVICEGQAFYVSPPYPTEVLLLFKDKYDWDITTEKQYSQLVKVEPVKWLAW